MHFAHCWNTKYRKIIPFIHPSTHQVLLLVLPDYGVRRSSVTCNLSSVSWLQSVLQLYMPKIPCIFMCLLFFVKVRQNDKSLLPLQQIEDVAFLATCFPLNIFPTGGKNVGYYSRPSETKKSCVNSRFSQTRIIVIDMHSFYMVSYGKCPYIDGAKHKYCSDNSAVKHICNQ